MDVMSQVCNNIVNFHTNYAIMAAVAMLLSFLRDPSSLVVVITVCIMWCGLQSSDQPLNLFRGGVSLPPRIEPTPPINVVAQEITPVNVAAEEITPINVGYGGDVASPSHSAISADEEIELDYCLEKVATLIVNKLREIKGLKLKDVPKENQQTKLSWDFLKINSDHLKDLKEILNEGMSCAESLQKYILEHGGKDMTQAVIPILEGIRSYHWITSALLLVEKTLERWEAVTENKEECLELLEEMAGLALILKQIRDRKMSNQNMEALIKEAVERVFKGYLLCCYQMSSSRLCGLPPRVD